MCEESRSVLQFTLRGSRVLWSDLCVRLAAMYPLGRTVALVTTAALAVTWASYTITSTAPAKTDVVTYHNDVGRTGQNLAESVLSLDRVNVSAFGKTGLLSVDGKVDAQPLYLSALPVIGHGTPDVLYVATEHDSVYAFDA